ncbi:hypothetical protein C1X59_13595 [Pseudomonas sp. FW215-R2]|jgi:hypothetical protein|uniref:hypothetical protein n=1 Tax=unclassified Pseudomonas TaxID=196821 RepID=UPI000BD7C9DE|nr:MULTISPECIES: hypothetical protein [unclassified Pseudomonas]PCR93348.1 hypothetical protein CP336_26765 [Pseudomonas fluorescens]PMX00607.1 hypothetical protein C1X59_13595 [Pseudomonas sp. FW215-R2]PMX06707.1 hypothetical protein C1X60_23515 [Pseudomonas sp. FW215-L1]PMX18867.1 hypothetical protein C1X57_26145 [Pseudomonas sp. FW215-E1]PNA23730.1 hypothetical protein C1X58_25020 [Pseudomonas sp. FW215-R4]
MDVWHMIFQFAEWLGEKHSSHGRWSYGYMAVLNAAVAVGTWVVAREQIAKSKVLKDRVTTTLASRSLTVTSFAEEGGQQVRFTGVLLEEEGVYTVTLTRQDVQGSIVSSSDGLHSLEEVDRYLRGHTPFILSDFRR